MGVKIGLSHQGKSTNWGFWRMGHWGRCLHRRERK